MRKHATVERLEQTSVALHVIATDVLRGEEVRLSRGPLVEAVMASAAIPGVFPPVEWDGRQLIDGGVSNNVPLSHAVDLGADRIYVLPTGAPCELKEPPRGALPMLLYATGLLIGHRWQAERALLDPAVDLVVLPPPCPLPVQPTDFSRADELIERGRRDARRYLRSREAAAARRGRPRRTGRNPALTANPSTL
jgi:NTE family protein